MQQRRRGTAVLALLAPLALTVGALVAAGSPAQASCPPDDPCPAGARAQTVSRALGALSSAQGYKIAGQTGKPSMSNPKPAQDYNYLGRNGSNANRNEYNGYNGEEWCGWFAAAVWTGVNRPSAATHTELPAGYKSSQAWMNKRFHAFRQGTLPGLGDVLVWTNKAAGTGGHVGVVVGVDTAAKRVTTIEGNAQGSGGAHDSIVRKTYAWDADGPTYSDKTFRGFAARL